MKLVSLVNSLRIGSYDQKNTRFASRFEPELQCHKYTPSCCSSIRLVSIRALGVALRWVSPFLRGGGFMHADARRCTTISSSLKSSSSARRARFLTGLVIFFLLFPFFFLFCYIVCVFVNVKCL